MYDELETSMEVVPMQKPHPVQQAWALERHVAARLSTGRPRVLQFRTDSPRCRLLERRVSVSRQRRGDRQNSSSDSTAKKVAISGSFVKSIVLVGIE